MVTEIDVNRLDALAREASDWAEKRKDCDSYSALMADARYWTCRAAAAQRQLLCQQVQKPPVLPRTSLKI